MHKALPRKRQGGDAISSMPVRRPRRRPRALLARVPSSYYRQLAGILEGDPMYGGGRVDLATGEVWPAPAVDYAREIGQEDDDESDDPDKWLWVHCEGSRDGYRDMELFIGTVRDPARADRLEIAISGRGALSSGLLVSYWSPARTDVMRCVLKPSQCIRPR